MHQSLLSMQFVCLCGVRKTSHWTLNQVYSRNAYQFEVSENNDSSLSVLFTNFISEPLFEYFEICLRHKEHLFYHNITTPNKLFCVLLYIQRPFLSFIVTLFVFYFLSLDKLNIYRLPLGYFNISIFYILYIIFWSLVFKIFCV